MISLTLALIVPSLGLSLGSSRVPVATDPASLPAGDVGRYASMDKSVRFVENRGQWNARAKYRSAQ